jgi:hypothetical protein
MNQAQQLVKELNAAAKAPQFSYVKARAVARRDDNVDWTRTKTHNTDFNSEVDGCESFVMKDGTLCAWLSSSQSYTARGNA